MKTTNFTKILAVLMMAFTLITFQSCDKQFNDAPFEVPPQAQRELVSQSFGLNIGTEAKQMNTKSWNVLQWQPEYSPTAYNLVVTGTGSSVGTNYTKSVTVAELKAGITFDMLAGSYDVDFETVHTQDPNSMNGFSILQLTVPKNKTVGRYLDIKIDNSVNITGSPLQLVATLEDALIVIDVPEVTKAYRQVQASPEALCSLFLNDKKATDGILYGYVNAQPLYVSLEAIGWQNQKVVNLTQAQNGRAYHLVTPFNAVVELNIPNLVAENIIVP
jgi:hypothetical protein